jgi:hypothetical protein
MRAVQLILEKSQTLKMPVPIDIAWTQIVPAEAQAWMLAVCW